jgi:hypothetical protein
MGKEYDVDPLPSSNVKIKNGWNYSPYMSMWHQKVKLHLLPQHFPVYKLLEALSDNNVVQTEHFTCNIRHFIKQLLLLKMKYTLNHQFNAE